MFLSGFSFPDGASFYNGPYVQRGDEAPVRALARSRLLRDGGYWAVRSVEGVEGKAKREKYFLPVGEEDVEAVVSAVYVYILPFRSIPTVYVPRPPAPAYTAMCRRVARKHGLDWKMRVSLRLKRLLQEELEPTPVVLWATLGCREITPELAAWMTEAAALIEASEE